MSSIEIDTGGFPGMHLVITHVSAFSHLVSGSGDLPLFWTPASASCQTIACGVDGLTKIFGSDMFLQHCSILVLP